MNASNVKAFFVQVGLLDTLTNTTVGGVLLAHRFKILAITLLCSAARAGPIECITAGVEHVHVDLGVYTLTEPLRVPSNTTIFCEPGTVFEAAEGAFLGVNDSLVIMENSANVSIHNCTFKGRKADYLEPPYELSEFRHVVALHGAERINLYGVRVESGGGDGLYVGPFVSGPHTEDRKPSKNVTIERLASKGNLRTGMAVISAEGLTVRNSTFEDTVGVSTGAGINCEPAHGGDKLENIVFERCTARNNAGSSFRVNMDRQTKFSKPISVTFKDCLGESIYNGHYVLSVNQFEKPMNPIRPLGFIKWETGSATWSNP